MRSRFAGFVVALSLLLAIASCSPPPCCDGGVDAGDSPRDESAPDDIADADPLMPDVTNDLGADAVSDGFLDAGPGCSQPVLRALNVPDNVTGMLMGESRSANVSCTEPFRGATTGGPDDVFALTVAARTGVIISVRGGSTMPPLFPVVSVRRTCDVVSSELGCALHAPDVGLAGDVRIVLEPGTYFVVVDEVTTPDISAAPLAYTLSLSAFVPAPNAACTDAVRVAPGVTLAMQRTGGGSGGVSCGASIGSRVFYAMTIPPNSRLILGARPTARSTTDRIALQVIDGCATGACLASAFSIPGAAIGDAAGSSVAANAVVDNTTSSPRQVIISVGSATGSSEDQPFELTSMLVGMPYRETTIAGACDDLSTATAITPMPPPWDDDATTPVRAMPFRLLHFGYDVGFYSVASNGFLQLWPTSSGTPNSDFRNTPLPSTAAPASVVAPFWDDLAPLISGAMVLSDVRVATLGPAGRQRLTVQWGNWLHIDDPRSHFTFQVKLFQTTNVIEFHYCALTQDPATSDAGAPDPDLITGNSATIGMQSTTQNDGIQHSYNARGSVMSGTGLRFTPL